MDVRVCIAGVAFTFSAGPGVDAVCLHPDYLPFLDARTASEHGASIHVLARAGDDWPQTHPSAWRWESFMWRLGDFSEMGIRLDVRDLIEKKYVPVALLHADFGSGDVVVRQRKPRPAFALNYPEGQIILLNRLAMLQAGLVHSSALVIDGRGYLFCGRSGAGKTTIARLWKQRGGMLLCDDRNIVRWMNGCPFVCSTPWHGEDPEVNPVNVPLGGIFHLHQAPENRVEEIPMTQAVARLYATSLAPFYDRTSARLVLDGYVRCLDSVPSYDLHFTPDLRATDAVLRVI